nr:snakin 5 [Mentha longifolia]
MKATLAATILLSPLLCATMVEISSADAFPPSNLSPFCKSKCDVRCSKTGRKNRCLLYCGICCGKCKCVPSGTFGNKDECPCYRDLKNSKGLPKCP